MKMVEIEKLDVTFDCLNKSRHVFASAQQWQRPHNQNGRQHSDSKNNTSTIENKGLVDKQKHQDAYKTNPTAFSRNFVLVAYPRIIDPQQRSGETHRHLKKSLQNWPTIAGLSHQHMPDEMHMIVGEHIGKYDTLLAIVKKKKLIWLGHDIVVRTKSLAVSVDRKISRGSQARQLMDNVKEWARLSANEMWRELDDRVTCRTTSIYTLTVL